MANRGTTTTYVDIHNNGGLELNEEEFLPIDLIRNWQAAWKNDETCDSKFVEYQGSIQAKKRLWYNGWVTICGYPGDGKSSIVNHLVSYFAQEPSKLPDVRNPTMTRIDVPTGHVSNERLINHTIDDEGRQCYMPVYINGPLEYQELMDPNLHQIIVIDDIFGEAVMQWRKLEEWRPYLEHILWDITARNPKTLVIICINKAHLDRAPNDIAQLELFKPAAMIDLQKTHRLKDEDWRKMMKVSRQERAFHRPFNTLHSIPLLCRMRNLVTKFEMVGEDFFKNPWERCIAEIDQIYKVDRILYYTLAVAVLLDGKLSLDKRLVTEYDGRTGHVMEQLITLLGVPLDVNQSKMRFAAKLLTGFFFRSVDNWKWEIFHPRVYSLCLTSVLKHNTNSLIELLSKDVIDKYVRTEELSRDFSKELVVGCTAVNYSAFVRRLILGLVSGHMLEVVSNESFQEENFVSTFYKQVKEAGCLGQIVFQKDPIYGRSFFYWACHYGHGHLVKAILMENEELNVKNDARFEKEFTWGYIAACASPAKTSYLVVTDINEIVGFGIEHSKQDKENTTAQILGNDFNYLLSFHAPPLHIASLKGHHNTVEFLIDHGADTELKTSDGTRPIHRAAGRKDKEGPNVVQTLLKYKVNIETKTSRQFTALDEAVESGSVDSVRLFVLAGADINKVQGDTESSYLAKAIQRHDHDLVNFLVVNNPNLNGCLGIDIFPPLSLAVQTGDVSLVDFLLRKNINVDCPGSNGWVPLHVACFIGNKDIVELLVDFGANVNIGNSEGNTPLHIAAEKGSFDICEALLKKGGKTEVVNKKGETPVVCAARKKHGLVTWLLLREGMDLGGSGS